MRNKLDKYGKKTIWVVFLSLIALNIFVFMNGVKLSDEVYFYEGEISKIKAENIKLEQKVYMVDSVTYAASVAAELDFSKKSETLFLEEVGYARNN